MPLNDTYQPTASAGLGERDASRCSSAARRERPPRPPRRPSRAVSSSASRVWTTTGPIELARERELRGERAALEVARRVVVVVVETTLADRDGAALARAL